MSCSKGAFHRIDCVRQLFFKLLHTTSAVHVDFHVGQVYAHQTEYGGCHRRAKIDPAE